MTTTDPISFSFGENWQNFIAHMPAQALERAFADTTQWLSDEQIRGKSLIDIGCGSGIHSLIFHQRGAASILSIDRDERSVAATTTIHGRAGAPANWTVRTTSILDDAAVARLPGQPYGIVYSWGVLHHTGDLWKAMDNAVSLLAPRALLWISLYAKGPLYRRHLALKRRYNAASRLGKWLMERWFVLAIMFYRIRLVKNPFAWREKKVRGMDTWFDIVDWLGGLPYEVASIDEVVAFGRARGLELLKIEQAPEGSCHVFLFQAGAAGITGRGTS
jgi:2-polyprenyl-3-methyl-5-hydroxy-6-metoxy-1,4-benzoquinol methylase